MRCWSIWIQTTFSYRTQHVVSQAICAGHKFRTVTHRWPSTCTGKKYSGLLLYEPSDTPVPLRNLVHLSCPSCGVRNTLLHSMKTEPPINYIVLCPIGTPRGTKIFSLETHRWPSWEPTIDFISSSHLRRCLPSWGFRFSRQRVYRWLVFWDAASCSLVEVYQRFKSAYCLHHQGDDQTARRNIPEASHLRLPNCFFTQGL
jgi:hypothetical protein